MIRNCQNLQSLDYSADLLATRQTHCIIKRQQAALRKALMLQSGLPAEKGSFMRRCRMGMTSNSTTSLSNRATMSGSCKKRAGGDVQAKASTTRG